MPSSNKSSTEQFRSKTKPTPIGFRYGRILGAIGMIRSNLKMIRRIIEENPQFMAPEYRHLWHEATDAIERLHTAIRMEKPASDK